MNVLQHTRNELNLCLKQNQLDRSYRDILLMACCEKKGNLSLVMQFENFEIYKDL